MHILMRFMEKNILNLGPELQFPMRAEQIAQSLTEAKHLYEARWDRAKWQDKKEIWVEVSSPILGRHSYEISGTENELQIVARALELYFAQH